MATIMAEFDPLIDEAPPPSTLNLGRVIIWLVVLSLLALLIPLYVAAMAIREAQTPLRDQLSQLEAQINTEPTLPVEEETLRAQLLDLQRSAAALAPAAATLTGENVDLVAALGVIAVYDPLVIGLTGLTQEGRQLTLMGWTADEAIAMSYAQTLRDSGLFERVVISTLTLMPTRVPAATPDAVAPAVTRIEFTILAEVKVSHD